MAAAETGGNKATEGEADEAEIFSFHHIPLTPTPSPGSPREHATPIHTSQNNRSFNNPQLHSSPFPWPPITIPQSSSYAKQQATEEAAAEANTPQSTPSRQSSFKYSVREGWTPMPSPLSRVSASFPSSSDNSVLSIEKQTASFQSLATSEELRLQEEAPHKGLKGMDRSRRHKSKWQQVRGRVRFLVAMKKVLQSGNRHTKRLLVLVVLNVAYSTLELLVGLLTGRIGLVSDSFHLTFGCGVLTFSLFAMVVAKRKPDEFYTFGYKRLEVLAAFTNALFLLFLCFSLAVEALHAFVQDESEHKHYLIVSAVTNLAVNLLGVWFFRSYARVRIVYRKAEDMNNHSICLHVISDSIRSAGVILASWLLLLGVKNAETLCLGLVAITIFLLTFPLFKASGGVLLQMVPTGISGSAFNKCLRQVRMHEDVQECYSARFWELVPGFVVGTLLLQVKPGSDEQKVLKHVHSVYNDIGVKDLTVQIETEQQ